LWFLLAGVAVAEDEVKLTDLLMIELDEFDESREDLWSGDILGECMDCFVGDLFC
jgi:hypothetical protein